MRITRLLSRRSWITSIPQTPHVEANVQNTDIYYKFFLLTEGSIL